MAVLTKRKNKHLHISHSTLKNLIFPTANLPLLPSNKNKSNKNKSSILSSPEQELILSDVDKFPVAARGVERDERRIGRVYVLRVILALIMECCVVTGRG